MEVSRFSPTGEHLAVSGTDGRLRLWETSTNVLKQEFIPSSHLTSTCTCIEWAPAPTGNQTSGKKKKRKRTVEGDVLVMGTATGSLLFYGLTKAQLLSQHKNGHSGKVTGLSWSGSTLLLYSCGEDGYIIEWDPEITKQTSRWKSNKSGLSAIRVLEEDLLTAGHGVTLWDLNTRTPKMTFTGHPSVITQMETIPGTDYFVTMSHTERHLRIWSVKEKNSVLSLTVPEPPQSFSVLNTKSGQVVVAGVTRKGLLHVFKHRLNGHVKKPLLPAFAAKIVDSSENSTAIPFLASHMLDEGSNENLTILTSYGSWLRLRSEMFPLNSFDSQTIIKRDWIIQKKKGKNKNRANQEPASSLYSDVVEVPNNVKHLQDGLYSLPDDAKTKKRKNVGDSLDKSGALIDDGELPMEERLTNLTIDSTTGGGTVPNPSNLAHLLSQGLHSKDARILQSVLCRWDEAIISNTVRSLPVQLIIPLLTEIRQMLGGKAQQNHSLLKWLKNVFQIHSAYLMSCPSSTELLVPFMNLLRSREALYPQMCQLKGKLELIKGNIQTREFKTEQPNEALLVYQDESSGDEAEDDTFLPSETEGFLETDDDLGVDNNESSDDDDDESGMEENLHDSDSSSDTETTNNAVKSKKSKTRPPKTYTNNNHEDSDDVMEDD